MENFNGALKTSVYIENERVSQEFENIQDTFSDDLFIFLTEDKEVLTSYLEGSKETIDGKIGDKETEIFRVI